MTVLNSRLEMLLDAVNGRVRSSDADAVEDASANGDDPLDAAIGITGADEHELSALRQLLRAITQYLGAGDA
ncbi:MAG: hypothetical protein ACRCTI_10530 [Beijerinckiaceae bacterium]